MPKSIGDSSVKVAVIDCFQSCSFPSLSIKEGFGFGFGPFVGILMEFKGNEQDETDLLRIGFCSLQFIQAISNFAPKFQGLEVQGTFLFK